MSGPAQAPAQPPAAVERVRNAADRVDQLVTAIESGETLGPLFVADLREIATSLRAAALAATPAQAAAQAPAAPEPLAHRLISSGPNAGRVRAPAPAAPEWVMVPREALIELAGRYGAFESSHSWNSEASLRAKFSEELTKIAAAPAQAAQPPNCGACPGDGTVCPTTCRLAEESPPL